MTRFIKSSQGFGLIGILIVIAVIALASGGGFYWNEAKKQQSLLQTGTDAIKRAEELKKQIESRDEQIYRSRTSIDLDADTVEWKTYRNEKYWFEFKYPSDWKINEQITGIGISKSNFHLNIFIESNPSGKAVDEEWFKQWTLSQSNLQPQGFDSSQVAFQGMKVLKINLNMIFFNKAVEVYRIQWLYPGLFETELYDKNSPMTGDRTLDSILSTFKFIEPPDTSTWKTYRNEKYGFEMKYPGNWKLEIIPDYDEELKAIPGTQIFFFTSDDLHRIIIDPYGSSLPKSNDSFSGWKMYYPSQKYPKLTISVIPINARDAIDQKKITLLNTIISTFKFAK